MTQPARDSISFSQSTASVLLDLIRGLAALLVLLSHWKIMFFVDYPKIPGPRWAFLVPYVLCDAGHQAVVIFFVLSGYLISGTVVRSAQRGTWNWGAYLSHRLTRLWVVLLPALLLGGIWDWLGLHRAHVPDLYNGVNFKAHATPVVLTLTAKAFWGNAAFLQGVFVPAFGSNGPLWSLADEFWYYILFPLAWISWRTQLPMLWRLFYLILLGGLMWLFRYNLLLLFPVWLAGAALHLLPTLRCGNASRSIAAVLYTPMIFVFAKLPLHMSDLQRDYAFGLLTTLFLWVVLSARDTRAKGWHVQPSRGLARCSFSLYALHMPALLLLTACILGPKLWAPTELAHDGIAFLVLGLLFGYAYLIASFTEFRTEQVRHWVERVLGVHDKLRS